MSDRATIWASALAGAVVGGVVGYLYFTERGRRLREDLEPRLDELFVELGRVRDAAVRTRDAAREGWESVQGLNSSLRGAYSDLGAGGPAEPAEP